MKKLLIVWFGLVLSITVFGQQNVFPENSDQPQWSYLSLTYGVATPSIQGFTRNVGYSGDTLLCGVYHSIYTSNRHHFDPFYLRQDSSKVFYKKVDSCGAKEYLLYDFSLTEGDSVWIYMWEVQDSIVFGVEEVFVDSTLTPPRKVIQLLSGYGPLQWIEGVGSNRYPFYSAFYGFDFCECSVHLLCLDSMGTNVYIDQHYSTCDTVIDWVGVEEIQLGSITMNTIFQDQLQINFQQIPNEPIRVTLFTLTGQAVETKAIQRQATSTINAPHLSTGIYLLEIKSGNLRTVRKVLKL